MRHNHALPGLGRPPLPMPAVSRAAWELSERIRRAKEAPALHPMMVDPRLASLTLTVEAGPPPVLVSHAIVQPIL